MTQDEIIQMARAACDTDKVDAWHNSFWTLTQEELERFAQLVAAHEREECAKYVEGCFLPDSYSEACLLEIANEIRARGNT